MSPSKICMLLGIVSLSSGLSAQEEQDSGKKELNANSRVERCLIALQEQQSFKFESSLLKSGSQALVIAIGGRGGRKSKPTIVEGTCEGSILSWSKDDGEEVIANQGRNWVSLDRDGDWVPSRKPVGSWTNSYLADPVFLAARLLHLLKESKWEARGTATIDEKALRLYRVELEPETAVHLVRSGAIPAGGGGLQALGGVVIFRAMGGGKIGMPEAETTVEVLLYEDPATHTPVKMTLNIFTKQGGFAGGGMRVVVRGMGGGFDDDDDDDDDDDEEKEKKKKPSSVLNITFADYGKAKAKDLNAEARSILSGKKRGI